MSAAPDQTPAFRRTPVGFLPPQISSLVQRRVVEQHAGEAAFLWTRRERAASAAHYKLKHLAMLDERVHAHLRGLRTAGEWGWRAAQATLEQADAGAVFVVSYLAFCAGNNGRMRQALQLALSEPSHERAFIAALAWLELEEIRRPLQMLQASPVSDHQRIALAAMAAHRSNPGEFLAAALCSSDSRLRARGMRAIGEIRRADLAGAAKSSSGDADPDVQFWANWSLALLGDADAPEVLLNLMTRKPQHEFFAIQVAMRCGAPGWGREQVRNLARRPETLRLAIQCAAAIGDPAVVPWLLGQTRDPRHGRIAGDAFWIITGADFEYLGLKQDAPEQDPPDARPEDSSLYWPDANGLAAWWNRERRRFQQGQRYLAGQPVSAKSALDALRTCSQRHRQAAAIELARADQTGPLFPIRDRSDRQDRQLAR